MYKGGNQRWPEFHAWVSLCRGMGIESYVELGCGAAHLIEQAGIPRIVTVDLEANGLAGIPHVRGNTHDLDTLYQVLSLLGGPPDAVFIDADHSTDAVRQDFDMWYPAATRLIAFHDILMPPVVPLWDEVSLHYPSVEMTARDVASADEWQTHTGHHPTGRLDCGGIGVIYK